MPLSPLLADRVILVTGATSGIGAAVARRAADEGARVMLHGHLDEPMQAAAAALGAPHAGVAADLAHPDSARRIVEATLDRFGRLDGLVNNAAVSTRTTLDSTDAAVFDDVIAVNLRAPLLLIRAALPPFRSQGRGVVVNIGSVNALCGEPHLLAYSVSKGGLATLTRNLADAHAEEGIRVNQLNVGWTLTEHEQDAQLAQGMEPGWERKLPPRFAPSGRIFFPEEIAAHAVFLLSDAAGPVSGTVYEVEQYPMIGRNPPKVD